MSAAQSPETPRSIVVVGGGLAAGKAVSVLREQGFDGDLSVLCAEPHPPYERPPLSKGSLAGDEPIDGAFVQPEAWYGEHHVDLRPGTEAAALDLDGHTVSAGGRETRYDRLLLATGSRVRHLQLADDSGAPVAYLRTIEDSERIKSVLEPGRTVAVVGGGWIGLEVAAAARTRGADVVVLEALEKPLLRVLGDEVADVFVGLHRSHGVDLRTGVSVSGMQARGERGVVHLADGGSVEADLVVVGVGIAPETALAESAGLRVDNGVVVDERLRSSHPDVFAAGDVANAFHPTLGRHLRVEHWDNALEQGATAARNLLGADESYDHLPYFFTDQYDLGMEYVGNVGPDGYDEVVLRGDVEGRVFTAFWLRGGTVVAGMQANDWDAMDHVRRVVAAGRVDLSTLRDSNVALEEVAT
jgi:3-phenylpropionate/trans-cinnamate dioxygenase ferredoxin reductase component